jgi:hypothetical protein
LSSWPRRTAISLAVAASQMRAVLSADAVTVREPSGLKAADDTPLSWPRRTAISLALAASQMRAVPSNDAVMMREPSGLNPLHDWTSHGVDALRTFACGFDDTPARSYDPRWRGRQGEPPPRGSFWSA